MYYITAKTNIPEYHIFHNYSYRTFENISSHFIYEKIKQAKINIEDYDKMSLQDIESGNIPLKQLLF